MFRNYIPTFFTTKNPVFKNYGFDSVMFFCWFMTIITIFHLSIIFEFIFVKQKFHLKNIHKKIFIVS